MTPLTYDPRLNDDDRRPDLVLELLQALSRYSELGARAPERHPHLCWCGVRWDEHMAQVSL